MNDEHIGGSSDSAADQLSNAWLMAFVGGFLDGFTYVGHGHVFANAMTGNVVILGIGLLSRDWLTAWHHLLPLITFLLGIATATSLTLPKFARLVVRPRLAALSSELLLLAIVGIMPDNAPDIAVTSCIAFAAALQMQHFRKVNGQPYNSTFTTGNLRTLGESLFDLRFGPNKKVSARTARDFSVICFSFLSGAASGGVLTAHFRNRAIWMDVLLLATAMYRIYFASSAHKQ